MRGTLRGQKQLAPNEAIASQAASEEYKETGTNQYLLCKNLLSERVGSA